MSDHEYGINLKMAIIPAGLRVELHPGTDAWMMGDRYGEVIKLGRKLVHVKMDRSHRVRKLRPENVRIVR